MRGGGKGWREGAIRLQAKPEDGGVDVALGDSGGGEGRLALVLGEVREQLHLRGGRWRGVL